VRHTVSGSGPVCVSSDGSVVPTSSFATHRLHWVSYPAFYRYYEDAKTPSARLSAFAFRSAPITSTAFSFLAIVGEKRTHYLGSCCTGMIPIRLFIEETVGFDSLRSPLAGQPSGPSMSATLPFPASLETPITALPCSTTPGGLPHLTNTVLQCCPRY
jgi:hypothetical protein